MDVQTQTLIITAAIGGVGWALKNSITALIQHLIKLTVKTESLDLKMKEVVDVLATYPKVKEDLNEYYKRLKDLEKSLGHTKS